jgi:hypothetical protein
MVDETDVRWMSGDEFQRRAGRDARSRLRDDFHHSGWRTTSTEQRA